MVKRKVMCLRLVLVAALAVCWAGGGVGAASVGRDDIHVVTPMPEPRQYKYIPLRYGVGGEHELSPDTLDTEAEEDEVLQPKLAPSELILTVMRTALDVVRRVNSKRAAAKADRQGVTRTPVNNVTAVATRKVAKSPRAPSHGRGYMDDYYDEHHDTTTTTTPKPAKPRYTDPWAGYYDFIINEGSFKFWSVFQLFTAALLLYACFSAIYYAKFNPIIPDYDREYDDYFLERRSGGRGARSVQPTEMPSGLKWMSSPTFQFIMNAIAKNYELQG